MTVADKIYKDTYSYIYRNLMANDESGVSRDVIYPLIYDDRIITMYIIKELEKRLQKDYKDTDRLFRIFRDDGDRLVDAQYKKDVLDQLARAIAREKEKTKKFNKELRNGYMEEAYNTAPLMNVRNQLMNNLGGKFDFIGGSMNPKFTMTYKKDPSISFDVALSGNNIEMTPKHDDIPDYIHKIKGISIMRAAQVILDAIKKFINEGVCSNMKLMIKESNYMTEALDDVREYAELNIKRFNKVGLKYGCQFYGDVTTKDGEVYLDGYDKARSDVDSFCNALNRIMRQDGYSCYVLKTKPDVFSIIINER